MPSPAIPKPKHIFRILHFSDIHTGLTDFQWGYLFDKRLFGRMNQFLTRQRRLHLDNLRRLAELQRSLEVDFTVCTGDLTSIGSDVEFRHAKDLLRPVLEYAGDHFLFVPGNHDAYVKGSAGHLADAFRDLNHGLELQDLPAVVDAGPVEFVLLNPARPCHVWLSTGELSEAAWRKLDYILSSRPPEGKVRVLLTHFPPIDHHNRPLSWRTRLLRHERLLEYAERHVFDALLAGHVHHPFLFNLAPGGPVALGAGSLTIQDSCAVLDVDSRDHSLTAHLLQHTIP